jgi:hypothetical protein
MLNLTLEDLIAIKHLLIKENIKLREEASKGKGDTEEEQTKLKYRYYLEGLEDRVRSETYKLKADKY